MEEFLSGRKWKLVVSKSADMLDQTSPTIEKCRTSFHEVEGIHPRILWFFSTNRRQERCNRTCFLLSHWQVRLMGWSTREFGIREVKSSSALQEADTLEVRTRADCNTGSIGIWILRVFFNNSLHAPYYFEVRMPISIPPPSALVDANFPKSSGMCRNGGHPRNISPQHIFSWSNISELPWENVDWCKSDSIFFNLCIWSSRVSTYVDLSGQGKTVAKYIRDTVYTSVSGLVKSMLSHCGSTWAPKTSLGHHCASNFSNFSNSPIIFNPTNFEIFSGTATVCDGLLFNQWVSAPFPLLLLFPPLSFKPKCFDLARA